MTFGQFLSILLARKWVALLVLALVVATSVIASLLLPRQYVGRTSVVIELAPDPVTAMALPASAWPSFMATQIDILASDRVALRVIRDLKLAENPQVREQWQIETEGEGTIEQWLVGALRSGLDLKPSPESNVITIEYKARDPRFAAGMANAFAQAYVATTLDLRVDPARQFTGFFGKQIKDARDTLERTQGKLSDFERSHGIVATDEQLDVESARLYGLTRKLVQAQVGAADSGSRQAAAQGAQGDSLDEVLKNPLISGLKAELARNEARLQELNARLGANHPQVVEVRAGNAQLRARIDEETRRITGSVGVSGAIDRQREAQARHEVEAQRAKLLQMKTARDEGRVLKLDVEVAQRAYDDLMARRNQTALQSQATQGYVNVLSQALPPTEQDSPRLLLNVAMAVLLGTPLAVGVALMLELSDRRMRAPQDIAATLGLPLLGALPKPGTRRLGAAKPDPRHQQRVMSLSGPAANKTA